MDTNGIRDTARAIAHSHAEMHLIEHLKQLRNRNSEQFVKAICNTNRTTAKELFRRFDLTPQEMAFFVAEIMLRNNWSLPEAIRKLGIGKAEPTGKESLLAAMKLILTDNPNWKKHDLQRFVDANIKSHFTKEPKPFTNQHVTDGASWLITTREKFAEKKAETDYRSRSRANVPKRTWEQFFRLQGWPQSPEFADKFIKSVNAEVRKQEKGKATRIATK